MVLRAAFLALIAAAACAAADPPPMPHPAVIHVGTPQEARYLTEDHSAVREINTADPESPMTRVADGTSMWYTYRFRPGRAHMAYLLASLTNQFLVSVSSDGGRTYSALSEMKAGEACGTRVLLDLTPHLQRSDEVLVRFEDRYKEDGWGALLSRLLYYDEGPGPASRVLLNGAWRAGSHAYAPGSLVAGGKPVRFTTSFTAPAAWRSHRLALYLAGVRGTLLTARVNDAAVRPGATWDDGAWADVSAAVRPGRLNRLELVVRPANGRAGVWAPCRVGLLYPATAVPTAKRLGGREWRANQSYGPYTPRRLNCLAGNFMQCLFDDRCDLLAFAPGEMMPVHFLHDTFRSLVALAEEERYTPVARVELARRLYRGCKRGMLPGGEMLFAFKHDERPIDIRPLAGTPDLTMVEKMDNPSNVASIGLEVRNAAGAWVPARDCSDTEVARDAAGCRFTRTWRAEGRRVAVRCFYPPGGTDRAPHITLDLDGRGPVRLVIGRLAETGFWFAPGSWGPEALVMPDGREAWAPAITTPVAPPHDGYLFVRGGNGFGDGRPGDYTYSKALLAMWDTAPSQIVTANVPGGRRGQVIGSLALEYANGTPGHATVTLMPFAGYPDSLKSPRLLAARLRTTGRFGMGIYDPTWTTNCNGIGPDGLAAAAYLFRKYRCPEAAEAEALAVRAMQVCIDLDRAGIRTNEMYYLLSGCVYLHLMGHHEFDTWARTLADRIAATQAPDGSWTWLNYQLRNMQGLLRAHQVLGDARYLSAVRKGLATLSYRDDRLYWHGKVDYYDDFGGALTLALYGYLGMPDMAAQAVRARTNYIDDRGISACSDLNPYMLGMSARGLAPAAGPRLRLGLAEFADYGAGPARKRATPSAYVVNPHHPLAHRVRYPLPP